MGEIFIGHGGLVPDNHHEGMGVVAVPPGTTIQFYTDAGQILRLGRLEHAFAHLEAPWPPLTSENVTYNLSLTALNFDTTQGRWTAITEDTTHTPHAPGWDLDNPILLCNGTVDQCPTDPRENRAHACTGILARFTGELHWISCTVLVDLQEDDEVALDHAMQGRPQAAFLNSDPDSWAEHTANLVQGMKRILELAQAANRPQEFVNHFLSDNYTDDERMHVVNADAEILVAMEAAGQGYHINSWGVLYA